MRYCFINLFLISTFYCYHKIDSNIPDIQYIEQKRKQKEEKKDISMTIISGKFTYIHVSASSRQTVAMRRVA